MSDAKHTPGPWHVGADLTGIILGDLPGRQPTTRNGWAKTVCKITHASWADVLEHAANARLIAASPDMLAALKRANEFITNGIELGFIRMPDAGTPDPAHETPEIVRAAIAKAEGRT